MLRHVPSPPAAPDWLIRAGGGREAWAGGENRSYHRVEGCVGQKATWHQCTNQVVQLFGYLSYWIQISWAAGETSDKPKSTHGSGSPHALEGGLPSRKTGMAVSRGNFLALEDAVPYQTALPSSEDREDNEVCDQDILHKPCLKPSKFEVQHLPYYFQGRMGQSQQRGKISLIRIKQC